MARSTRGANGPAMNAIQNQILVDLPRTRAMWSAKAIEASEMMMSAHDHIWTVSGWFC